MGKGNHFSGPILAGTIRQGAGQNVGSPILTQTGTIAHTDTSVTVATLPANAQILEIVVDVTTAFNDTGTDLLDIGDGSTANLYADNLNLAALGRVLGSSDASQLGNYADIGASNLSVVATYTGQNGNASAGAARITVYYVQDGAQSDLAQWA